MIRYFNLYKSFKNWYFYLAYKYSLVKVENLTFETRNGIIVEVPKRLLQTFKEIFMDECYLAGLEREIPPASKIIDIGANAGYFTLFVASRFPQASIFAFEPIPINYSHLRQQRDLNRLCNVSCFPLAVAGHCGEIQLCFDASDSFTTSATILSPGIHAPDSLNVECLTLQKIFDDNGIGKCDLLKMDCEGAEYDILYSCPPEVLRRVDQIAMEVHLGERQDQNIIALEAFLKQQGFLTRRKPVSMLWAWRN